MPSLNKNTFSFFAVSIIVSLLFLTACDAEKTDSTPEYSATSINQAWSITLDNWEIADDLTGTESAMQYNGDVTQIQIKEMPTESNTFLLVELTIEKQKSGASSFVWKDLFVLDEEGNKNTFDTPTIHF